MDAYGRVLALLPRGYREQRGAEMHAVMLDAAEGEGRSGPSFGEMLSVLGLALRLRTGAPGATPRARSVGDALRLITLLGLLLQAAAFSFAPAQLLNLLIHQSPAVGLSTIGTWHLVSELCGFVCPFLALAALLRGRRVLGLILTTNALALPSALRFPPAVIAYPTASARMFYIVALCAIPTIAGLLSFHRAAPRIPKPRYWIAAVFLATVPLVACDFVSFGFGSQASNLFLVACGCAAVGVAMRRSGRGAVWPAALMVATAPLLLTLPYAVNTMSFPGGTGITVITRLGYMNPMITVALYALGVEVLLALTLAVSLLRRPRTNDAPSAL